MTGRPPPPVANRTSVPLVATPAHPAAISLAILKGVSFSFNFISIAASLVLIVIFYFFRSRKPLVLNRVSLRLIVAMAYANILYSVVQIMTDSVSPSSPMCVLTPYLYVVLTLLTVFLTAAVAFNLHTVFVLGREGTVQYERWYYLVPLVLAAALPAPALFYGKFGWTPVEESCWFVEEGGTNEYFGWVFGSYYLWLLLALLYCLFVVVRVTVKLVHKRKAAVRNVEQGKGEMDHTMRKKMRLAMLQMVSRNVRYPAVPIATQSFNVIHDSVLWWTGKSVYVLMFLSYVGTALQGLLTLIVFVLDPAVQRAYDAVRKDAVLEYLHEEDMWNEKRAAGEALTSKDYGGVGARLQRWIVRSFVVDDYDRAAWLKQKMLQAADPREYKPKSYGSDGSSSFGSSDDEDPGDFHFHDDDAQELAMPAPVAHRGMGLTEDHQIFAHSDSSSMSSVEFEEPEPAPAVPEPALLAPPDAEFESSLTPDIPGRPHSADSLDRVAAAGHAASKELRKKSHASSLSNSWAAGPRISLDPQARASLQQMNLDETLERLKHEEERKEESGYWGEMSAL